MAIVSSPSACHGVVLPSYGNDDGGMDRYPPIVQLEPLNGSNVDRGDMEWEQDDEEHYDDSQADVGVPSQVLLTPRTDYSSVGSLAHAFFFYPGSRYWRRYSWVSHLYTKFILIARVDLNKHEGP